MKKNILYLAVLLAAAAVVFYIFREKKEKAEIPDDQAFAVEDTAAVTRISLIGKDQTADLRRENGRWTVNKKFKVMPSRMDLLLETLKNVEVQFPVPKAQLQSTMQNLQTRATKVEVYRNGERKPFKVYHVGGATSTSEGTFMVLEHDGKLAEKPYVTHIPGMRGIINVRYFTNETDWRDTEIFDYAPEQIAEIKVEYPAAAHHSFTIKENNGDFEIHSQTAQPANSEVYAEGLMKYVSSFTFLNAEAFANEHPMKDSVMRAQPFAIIKVTDHTGDEDEMKVYRMPINRRSKTQFDQHGNELQYDIDRYFAVINNGRDFVIIQDFVFGKIFRKYSDFFIPQKNV